MSNEVPNLPLQSVCVAVERAQRIAGRDDGPWTLGVRDAGGELLASAMLHSYAQVRAFAQAMEDLGFEHALLEPQHDARCCDFTFRLRAPHGAGYPDLLAA